MTKSGLIEKVAERTPHISKKDTEVVVNTIFDSMTEALKQGERIEIRGFGSFQVKVREAREGRNPKTGEAGAHPRQADALLQGGQGAEGDGRPLAGQQRQCGRREAGDEVRLRSSGAVLARGRLPLPRSARKRQRTGAPERRKPLGGGFVPW